MGSVKLAINYDAQRNEIEDRGGRDDSIPQSRARESFRAAVIFRHRLQDDAPPKVSVDLDVPFVPTSVDRVAPAFFFEQLKDRAEQMMTVASLIAPENAPAQASTEFRFGGQMFVRANDVARSAFEMEPREVTRKSANERLHESETHHEQTRRHRIELWFDVRAHHVGKRDGERTAKHQVGNDPQRREKNSQTEKKERERKPFDAAQVHRNVRLRRRVHRLEKSFAENTVINNRPIDEPTETRRAVNLAAPFCGAGRSEEN